MDEITKISFRNNISAFAYLLLALLGVMFTIGGATNTAFNPIMGLLIEVLVGASGIFLLILRKRDLTALCMLMFSMLFGYYTVTGGVINSVIVPVLLWFFIIFGLIMLGTKEKKKTSYFCVFFPYGIGAIAISIFGSPTLITLIMHGFFAAIALLYAIIYASEKVHLPLAKKLRVDEEIQFKKIGPVLGYYLFAVLCILTLFYQLNGIMTVDVYNAIFITGGIILIISGIINAIFSQQQFTPLMFIIMGISSILVPLTGVVMFFVAGGIFLVLSLVALLQKQSLILPAIMLLITGVYYLLMGFELSHPAIYIVLCGLSGLIALYLSFALLFEKKPLPIF